MYNKQTKSSNFYTGSLSKFAFMYIHKHNLKVLKQPK